MKYKISFNRYSTFTFIIFFAISAQTMLAQSPGYHLINKIMVGGEGGWDYLTIDSAARRLYATHSNHVVVIDIDSGKMVGEIADTKGVHGVAIVPEQNRGFTSNGQEATATIFDLKTLKTIGQVKTGQKPDAIIYDDASHHVLTFNGQSNDVTVIDPGDGKVVGTLALGGAPEFAAADGKGRVFVNLEDKSEVVAFDSMKLNIVGRWPLAPGEEPTGMAIDRANNRLFIGCHNKQMVVMDAANGHVITTLPIGSGVDATAFDPETKLAFSSNGDGTLTVVHEDSPEKFTVLENAATQRGARTMALDPKTHRIFLAAAQFGPAPAPTADRPRPRPAMIPGSFMILVMSR